MTQEKRRSGQRRSKTSTLTTNNTTTADGSKRRIEEVAESLRKQVHAFVAHFLPGGKWEGEYYSVLNPLRDDKNVGSFKIGKNGYWRDYAISPPKDRGDLLNLFQEMHRYSTPLEAVENLPSQFLNQPIASVTLRYPPKEGRKQRSDLEGWSYSKPTSSDYPPKKPIKDKNLGSPLEIYEFRGLDGDLIGLRVRFVNSEGKKEIRPYTLFQNKEGERAWKCAGLPRDEFKDGYPLYGLQKLSAHPEAAVLFVEGERTADKAQELLPTDFVTVTVYGGCQSIHLADVSVLKGRQVFFWADADEPGEKFVQSAARRIEDAGGDVVGIVNRELFLNDRGRLPEGYDAADAFAEGFTAEWILTKLQSKELFLPFEAPAASPEEHKEEQHGPFRRVPGVGVHFNNGGFEKKLCSDLRVLGTCADINNENWSTRVSFTDHRGVKKEMIISKEDIISGAAIRALGRNGLTWISMGQADHRHIREYLQLPGKTFTRIVPRTGWFSGQGCYVLPGETLGSYSENGTETEVVLSSDYAYSVSFDEAGTLEDWRREVAELCRGNSRLVLAICSALAGPLLKVAGEPSGGIHLVSTSSTGKTSALHVANSVWKSPAGVGSWNGTQHGIAAATAAANDGLLVLDEMGEADKKLLGQIVYQLGNTVERKRANNFGGALTGLGQQEAARVMTLSTGETGLRDTMADAGVRTHAGMEIRLIDLPADAGAEMGIVEELHGEVDSAALINRLKTATSKYYGTASRAFISKCIEDQEATVRLVSEQMEAFLADYLPEDAVGQVRRVAKRFALIAAAGELATMWGITGWQAGEATVRVGRCFQDWVVEWGDPRGQIEKALLIAQVRDHLERYGTARFYPLSVTEEEKKIRRIPEQAGYRRDHHSPNSTSDTSDKGNYLIFPGYFKQEICKGFSRRFAIDSLVEAGFLLHKTAKNNHVPSEKSSPKFYEISHAIFEAHE